MGDLNMKLKLEIGALRGENEGLAKKNDEVVRQVNDLENQIQVGRCRYVQLIQWVGLCCKPLPKSGVLTCGSGI